MRPVDTPRSFQTRAAIKGGAALAGVTAIVGSYESFLYALDSRTGALRWSTEVGAPFYATPTVAGGRVIDATTDGVVHALDAASGALLWSRRIGRFAYSAAAVAGSRVYIGSYDHRLYALDVRTGDISVDAPRSRSDLGRTDGARRTRLLLELRLVLEL